MKKQPLIQTENRVFRTYRGGKLLDAFLGKANPTDSFCPEDWISSFVEAKNKNYIPGEGISHVLVDGHSTPITEAVSEGDFGPCRHESGVLVKLLNSSERLGIQVHPTPDFSRRHFGTNYGKTECWHIIKTDPDIDAAVYIGFREGITREKWAKLFYEQDIDGMLNCLHRFSVHEGDTILVRAGTPHAIGAGCFLLEIQEPTDYTMRVEKTTVAGEQLTPMQIHYGAGEEALLDCFIYEGLTEEAAGEKYFLTHGTPSGISSGGSPGISSGGSPGISSGGSPGSQGPDGGTLLVSYDDTTCFALVKLKAGESVLPDSFVTLVVTKSGTLLIGDSTMEAVRGNKLFVPYGCGRITSEGAEVIVCYPPKI